MTPTLLGRWETRVLSVAVVGLVWTLLVTPLLPGGGRVSERYVLTLTALGLTAGIGVILWEPVYHLLQQFRWEKDWPAVFVLAEGVPEGLVVHWALVHLIRSPSIGWPAFAVDFGTTWLAIFVFIHGPIRVPFLRWRFRGGRIV